MDGSASCSSAWLSALLVDEQLQLQELMSPFSCLGKNDWKLSACFEVGWPQTMSVDLWKDGEYMAVVTSLADCAATTLYSAYPTPARPPVNRPISVFTFQDWRWMGRSSSSTQPCAPRTDCILSASSISSSGNDESVQPGCQCLQKESLLILLNAPRCLKGHCLCACHS